MSTCICIRIWVKVAHLGDCGLALGKVFRELTAKACATASCLMSEKTEVGAREAFARGSRIGLLERLYNSSGGILLILLHCWINGHRIANWLHTGWGRRHNTSVSRRNKAAIRAVSEAVGEGWPRLP